MKGIPFIVSILVLMSVVALGQINPPNPTVPSASLATIQQKLQISNDLYNGRINVSIPLLNYEYEGIGFPVALNYAGANGIKVDELPGWVGLGWGLTAGGYIHRTERGRPDEVKDFETKVRTQSKNGITVLQTKETFLNATDFSYFTNYTKINEANTSWSTGAYANSLKPSQPNNPYTLPGAPTSGGDDVDYTYYNHHPTYDLAPDEFSFSMGNISGKFYFSPHGYWVITANDGKKYKVEVFTGSQAYYNFTIPRIIKYITLTSAEGIKYYFGNSDLNAAYTDRRWDYSHASVNTSPLGNDRLITGAAHIDIVPHTWHLTKIENLKTGSVITFEYKQQGLQFYKSLQIWGHQQGIVYSNTQSFYTDFYNWNTYYKLSPVSKIVTVGWTLTRINFPNGVKIEFESTPSSQLSTNESVAYSDNTGFYPYEDMSFYPGYSFQNNTLLKLDHIAVYYENVLKKKIAFNYANILNKRLKLLSLKYANETLEAVEEYKFKYNDDVQLPAYASGKTDHWGYFNNKDFFASISPPYNDFAKLSNYSSYREPDHSVATAEILKKVIYPTGGFTEFHYEPHTYSKKRNISDFSLSSVSNNPQAGGVRIARITYKTDNNTIATERTFGYTTPGTSSSSGVLNFPPSIYLIGNATDFSFRVAGYSPIYYAGSHITYSYVTENVNGNGSSGYQYTNYDNDFNDIPSIEKNTNDISNFSYAYANQSFKRGKLHIQQVKKENNDLVAETINEYEHDKSESDKKEVRSLYLGWFGSTYGYASTAGKVYPDHLVSTENRTLSDYGDIEQTAKTIYDTCGNITEITTRDSRGIKTRQLFKYCYEYTVNGNDEISLGIKKLNDLDIKNSLIETITIREDANGANQKVISGTLYVYKPQLPFISKKYSLNIAEPLALASFTWGHITGGNFVKDTRYSNPDATVDSYDSKGNVLQVSYKTGIKEGFQWGYKNDYMVARVVNAQNLTPGGVKEFFYEGFEEGNVTGSMIRPYSGLACYTGNYTVAYTKPNTRNYWVDYRYFEGSRWKYIRKPFSNNMVLSEGDAIDEVRVYPEDAQMITYTYSPLVGVTSETDKNGKTVFYEYDAQNRLTRVYDEDKNLIKAICYNYLGQPENCLSMYGNDAMSAFFSRNNCGTDYVGEEKEYSLSSGIYISTISKEDANRQAANDIDARGQNYVNQHAACIPIVYARLEYGPETRHLVEDITERKLEEVRADLYIRFYSDAACTQEASVTDLNLNVHLDPDALLHGGGGQENMVVNCGEHEALVAQKVAIRLEDYLWNQTNQAWDLLGTTPYHHNLLPSPFIRIVQ